MGHTERRPPAVFDRVPGEWQPQPQFIAFPETTFAPEAPASPVIAIRYGQDVLQSRTAEPWVHPHFLPYPFFDFPDPANPVIPLRYGQDVLEATEEPWPKSRFGPFPYFEQPANPVIGVRYGRDLLRELVADPWVQARFGEFPYFDQPSLPIPLRVGRLAPPPEVEFPEAGFGRFPFFIETAAAAANPVIPFVYERLEWLAEVPATPWANPIFLPFNLVGEDLPNPVIALRYGRPVLLLPEAFVPPRFGRFPFFRAGLANPVLWARFGGIPAEREQAFVLAAFFRFPHVSETPVTAAGDALSRGWQESAPQWTNFIR